MVHFQVLHKQPDFNIQYEGKEAETSSGDNSNLQNNYRYVMFSTPALIHSYYFSILLIKGGRYRLKMISQYFKEICDNHIYDNIEKTELILNNVLSVVAGSSI